MRRLGGKRLGLFLGLALMVLAGSGIAASLLWPRVPYPATPVPK